MKKIENKEFKIAVITVSDRAFSGEREDAGGPAIKSYLEENDYIVGQMEIIPDEKAVLKEKLLDYVDNKNYDLVLTTGGTGLAERDITPEATISIADKEVPGIAEAIRAYSLTKTPHGMLSRGVAVIRKKTLIINFPGSPSACCDSLSVILQALPHALGLLRGEKLDK